MRLLIVEDDPNILDALGDALSGFLEPVEITVCRSRDSAILAIDSQVFDYAVLDLKIPTADDRLDGDVAHGHAVFERLRHVAGGTPICFLTAYATEEFVVTEVLPRAEKEDIWGAGTPLPMVNMQSKKQLSNIVGLLKNVKIEIDLVDDIEINADPHPGSLEARVLRIFARRNGAASLRVAQLSGGLSGIKVLRILLRDQHGNDQLVVAARLGTEYEIRDELRRYAHEVIRLPNGRFSVHTGNVFAGAGPKAGAFYRLAGGLETLADLVKRDPQHAALVVERLESAETPWTERRPESSHVIGEIRRRLVPDLDFERIRDMLVGCEYPAFEQRRIQAKLCCQHRDLHCVNVLVDNHDEPILIDFADVGEAPASLDPLTLEFSALFHPSCRVDPKVWPTIAQAESWADLDAFVLGCPAEQFIRAARAWSMRTAAGLREVYATAYSLAVRQLTYTDTSKPHAIAIIRSVIAAFQRT